MAVSDPDIDTIAVALSTRRLRLKQKDDALDALERLRVRLEAIPRSYNWSVPGYIKRSDGGHDD